MALVVYGVITRDYRNWLGQRASYIEELSGKIQARGMTKRSFDL